jgi:hypothetical protein
VAGHRRLQPVGGAGDGGSRVVQLVGQAGGEPPEGGQPLPVGDELAEPVGPEGDPEQQVLGDREAPVEEVPQDVVVGAEQPAVPVSA